MGGQLGVHTRIMMNLHTPVLVKSTLALITEMLCKDGFQGTQATDSANVSHDPYHDDRWSFNDGDRLNFFSL